MTNLNDEMKMFDILYEALEKDRVIPYYQGIYDNHTQRIDKYESLLRIEDCRGNIYLPKKFLDIAKKNQMYKSLTERMINKVFLDFEATEKMVSINLCAQDICSEKFTQNLISKIKKYPRPSNLVFEILEDENFHDIDILNIFIKKIKKCGAKIAIDDFGTGWFNLHEIIKVQPDYIKIAGDIVKDIHNNEKNKFVLKVIVSLAEKFSIKLVAEFVENIEIQKHIEELGISYSQGYYFSTPKPFYLLNIPYIKKV